VGAPGPQGPPGTGNASSGGADHAAASPETLTEYPTFETLASTTLTTTKASTTVLVIAQFTAQSLSNQGDVFAHLRMAGTPLNEGTMYWTTLTSGAATGTGVGRDTNPLSTLVTVPAGTHTFDVQGAYYFNDTDISVEVYSRRINVVELG